MKEFTIIILFVFLVIQLSHAQKKYSLENLEKASQEELDVYLNKALKLQKTGKTFNIVGVSCLGTAIGAIILGATTDFDDWGVIGICMITIPAGGASLAIGIPTNLTGKNRVERINTIKGITYFDASIDLSPCVQYNPAAQNYQPGIALRIRF
jgi:hypothetical protein